MKKILYLTFYFEPDLSAGSFRNTSLVKELAKQLEGKAEIDVFATIPNRYSSFQLEASNLENHANYNVHRIALHKHQNGMMNEIKSYSKYFSEVKKNTKGKKYDLVVASSSKLLTAYLGYSIAKEQNIPLYLDIRDIFVDTVHDVFKNALIKRTILPVLKIIEAKTFNYATHINLISAGFESYFKQFKKPTYSYFSNGIDEEFLNMPVSISNTTGQIRLITYAGNLGEGQGLHKIIPQAAKILGTNYRFIIIGDGGTKQALIDQIQALGLTNVELRNPVKRKELIEIYAHSDFLFMHLNDYDAFKKVLPSKVFELGAFDKPLIAGVAGYASQFITENIENKILFLPCDVENMVEQLHSYQYKTCIRDAFIEKFKRTNINIQMAASIRALL